jgi:hypothetical protein
MKGLINFEIISISHKQTIIIMIDLASDNFVRVAAVLGVAMSIVILVLLIIHYQEKIIKCVKKRISKIQPEPVENNNVVVDIKLPTQ